jgi:hypothetical protein
MDQLIVDVILGLLDGFHRTHEISPSVHVVTQDFARTCDDYLFVKHIILGNSMNSYVISNVSGLVLTELLGDPILVLAQRSL